jgi:uncharacterized protein (TIGR00730 family)
MTRKTPAPASESREGSPSRFGNFDGNDDGHGPVVRNFPSAKQDLNVVKQSPRYGGKDSSYVLAFADDEFMLHDDLRPIRMQMELLKPEIVQRDENVDATIVIFGSARILPRAQAQTELETALASNNTDDVKRARLAVSLSHHYEEARRFAVLVTQACERSSEKVLVCTGGGPGIMEAGNRGAMEAGGRSVGLNIVLPHEQEPNPYITPKLCFLFHYFGLRKMHFLMRAVALVCFPGGFGTLDEMFEVLTLIQTGKVRKRPIVLVGKEFWQKLINWDWLVETGMISPDDLKLFTIVDSADEAWAILSQEFGFEHAAHGDLALDV